jgi:hypothetical protein
MNIGMLWVDSDPKSELGLIIERAADYYRQQYGKMPDLCFVHPSMLVENKLFSGKIEIRSSRSILPHHLWIGIQ